MAGTPSQLPDKGWEGLGEPRGGAESHQSQGGWGLVGGRLEKRKEAEDSRDTRTHTHSHTHTRLKVSRTHTHTELKVSRTHTHTHMAEGIQEPTCWPHLSWA